MNQAIFPSLLAPSVSPFTPSTGSRSQAFTAASTDTVSLSAQARDKSLAANTPQQVAATETDETEKSLWETKYKIKAGTVTLKNGHKQKTSINGDQMEILEYDGSKLVRQETGSLAGGTVTKDIQEFSKNGKLTHHVHTELDTDAGGGTAKSKATLRRDVEWYEDGKMTKEFHDAMHVSATYYSSEKMNGEDVAATTNLEDIAATRTKDKLASDYVANILEYNTSGKLQRETTIAQSVKTENDTNHKNEAWGGLDAHSTVEVAKATKFTIDQATYDDDGNLSSQLSFSDSAVLYGSQTQQLQMSWYDKGQLVQQSQAESTQEQTRTHSLRQRPTMLEDLAITETQYSGSTPLDATTLLAEGQAKQDENPSSFLSPTINGIAQGGYNSAASLTRSGADAVPHSISWENTLYKDGKKVLQQTDTDVVRKNPLPKGESFHTLSGLTEDKDPAYVRSTSHSVETFQDGQARTQATVGMQEAAVDDARGMTRTETSVTATSGSITAPRTSQAQVAGTIARLDGNGKNAAQQAGNHLQLTLDDFRTLFDSLAAPADTSPSHTAPFARQTDRFV